MQLKERIMIFGDSIMKGVVLGESDRRYKISSSLGVDAIAKRFGLELDNRSRFGCTVEKGTTVLRRTIEREPGCGVVVLEYGGNDCDFNWPEVSAAPEAEHEPHTPLGRFREIYASAIEYLRSKSITPILTTLPPICAERYLNWICRDGLSRENILSWLGDTNAIYRYQERYSRAVEQLAVKYAVPLVDLRGAFLEKRQMEELYCEDGIHPNDQGQLLIRDTFAKFIEAHGISA